MHLQNLLLYQNPNARQGANFQIDGLRFELFCDNALAFFKYSFIFALPACMKTVKPLAGVDTYVLPVALLPLSLLLTPRQPARAKHRRIRNPGLKCAASRLEWLGFWEAGSFPILNRNATPERFTNWQQSSQHKTVLQRPWRWAPCWRKASSSVSPLVQQDYPGLCHAFLIKHIHIDINIENHWGQDDQLSLSALMLLASHLWETFYILPWKITWNWQTIYPLH